MIRAICSLLLVTGSASALAEGHEELVARAFDNLANGFEEEWAFTETAIEEGVTWVGRYDPSRIEAERWVLLSVDGRDPEAGEAEAWLADKHREQKNEDEDRSSGAEMFSPESLTLLEETDAYWLFSFVPQDEGKDGDEFMQHVSGELRIVKDGHYVALMDLHNEKPIRPAVGVKIKEFLTRLSFAPLPPDGPVVPMSVDVRVKGRAFFAISIDETASVRFSDYERVLPVKEMVPDR